MIVADDDSITGSHLGLLVFTPNLCWPKQILDCELLWRSELHQFYSVIFHCHAHFVPVSFLPPHTPNYQCHPSSFF